MSIRTVIRPGAMCLINRTSHTICAYAENEADIYGQAWDSIHLAAFHSSVTPTIDVNSPHASAVMATKSGFTWTHNNVPDARKGMNTLHIWRHSLNGGGYWNHASVSFSGMDAATNSCGT